MNDLLSHSALASPLLDLVPRQVDPAVFDAIVATFDGVVQEMTVAFATSRWSSVELNAWIYEHNSQPVAAVLVMIQKLPLSCGRLAVVKWGPILADENAVDREAIHEATVKHLQLEYAQRQRLMLSILARAERPPLLNAPQRLQSLGFQSGSGLRFPNRYIVNLRLTDAEQRKSLAQKWRYHLAKSEKEGLTFEVADDAALPVFDALYAAMTDRKRFQDTSAYNTVTSLFESPVPQLRPRIFLVRKDGVPVAGALIFTAGKTAVYLYGATNDDALRLRAGYYMHAHIASWLRDNTIADWYDLGGTDGFHGLHQFKKGLVGRAGLITPVPPIANYAAHTRARIVGTTAHRVRDGLHQLRRFINQYRGSVAQPDQGSEP